MNEREEIKMVILETMKARHSVRQYKNQAIESSKREKINALIKDVNAESKLSIQVFYDEPKCFDSFMAHYGKFENVKNYIEFLQVLVLIHGVLILYYLIKINNC